VTEWSARLPSALAATATVFLVYWYFGRQLGQRGGFVAALILPLSPLWLEKATAGDIDMLLVFWTTAAILFLLRALESEGLHWWLFALLCVAGGFLTKWTTPAFFYATALPLLWWRGQLRLLWSRQHLVSAAVAASVCLAWLALVIGRVGWPVFAATLEQEALQRLVPTYWGRPYPWRETLLHPGKLLLTGLPFSVLALVALRPGFYKLWDVRGQRLLQALHCWAWPNMLLWSLPTEHKSRFSFPLFPALSGLAAMVLVAWLAGKLPWQRMRLRPVHLLVGVLAVWIVLKVAYVHLEVQRDSDARQTRAKGQQLAALVPVDEILWLLGIKDEGLLFYFGRPALVLHSVDKLPPRRPIYCLMPEGKAQADFAGAAIEVVESLSDAQGDPIQLLRVTVP
jgi:4-amino-4-deoxy-L-arabinose transferase-like glycosyltransferase